jgi:hypothetical protein
MKIITRTVQVTEDRAEQMACTQDVCDTLGMVITPPFIMNVLKVDADFRRKNAYYWAPNNVEIIRARLIDHLVSL